MGILDAIAETASSILDGVRAIAKDVIEKIARPIHEFVDNVREGRWEKVVETIRSTIDGIVSVMETFSSVVPKALEQITGVALDSVKNVVEGVKTIGKFVLDTIKEHPQECASIVGSLIAALGFFMSGNPIHGAGQLVAAIVKFSRLRGVVEESHPETRGKYLLPDTLEQMSARFNEVDDADIDEELNRRADLYATPPGNLAVE